MFVKCLPFVMCFAGCSIPNPCNAPNQEKLDSLLDSDCSTITINTLAWSEPALKIRKSQAQIELDTPMPVNVAAIVVDGFSQGLTLFAPGALTVDVQNAQFVGVYTQTITDLSYVCEGTTTTCSLDYYALGGSISIAVSDAATATFQAPIGKFQTINLDGQLSRMSVDEYRLIQLQQLPLPKEGYRLYDNYKSDVLLPALTPLQESVVRWVATLPAPRPKVWIARQEQDEVEIDVERFVADNR
jgi:hypothetical protein